MLLPEGHKALRWLVVCPLVWKSARQFDFLKTRQDPGGTLPSSQDTSFPFSWPTLEVISVDHRTIGTLPVRPCLHAAGLQYLQY